MTADNVAEITPASPPVKRKKFPIVLIPLLVMVSCGPLNYAGFCFKEGWFLSEQTIINRIIENQWASINQDRKGELLPLGNYMHRPEYAGGTWFNGPPFKDIEEFRRLNPDCCHFQRTGPIKGLDTPDTGTTKHPFWKKFFLGDGRGFVILSFKIPVVKKDGEIKLDDDWRGYAVDNCGKRVPFPSED